MVPYPARFSVCRYRRGYRILAELDQFSSRKRRKTTPPGFQVTLNGRFWVSPEASTAGESRIGAAAVLNLGADMKLAWATAEWFEMFLVFNYSPGAPSRSWIERHEAVDWERFARERGPSR